MESKYFILKQSFEKKVIGCEWPQIRGEFKEGYDENAPNSIYAIPQFEIPNFEPNLDGPGLFKTAKKTDFLSCGMFRGWVVNEKIRNLFSKFNLIKHKYFPMIIYAKEEVLTNYYALKTEFDIFQYIDFEKTEFYAYSYILMEEYETIYVKSGEEYERKYDEVINRGEEMYQHGLNPRYPIYLKPDFPKDLDFFTVYVFISDPIISERLKIALEKEKVTGWEFVEVSEKRHIVFE